MACDVTKELRIALETILKYRSEKLKKREKKLLVEMLTKMVLNDADEQTLLEITRKAQTEM